MTRRCDDDIEAAGAVDAFDAFEFDVGGGAGPADHGQRPGAIDTDQCLREDADDVGGPDDADVVVRDQGDGTPALAGAGVEDDGAGHGDRDGAGGDHGVDGVQIGDGRSQAPIV